MVNLIADALELTLGLRLMKKVKVFAYVRCSHRLQRDDGFSLDTQRALISDYVAKMGLEVNEIVWIEDAAVSASRHRTVNRSGWSQMMTMATKGSVIVASTLDRIFRSVGDCAISMELLKKSGIQLHTTDKGCITNGDAAANLQLNVLTSVAQFESELRSRRIRDVKSWMHDNSMWMGGRRKRGFIKTKIGDRKFAVVDESEKLALQWIAEIKKRRDKAINDLVKERKHSSVRLSADSIYTIEAIQKTLVEKGTKLGISNLDKRFRRSSLFTLLGEDDTKNVVARLAKIKEVEKKILQVDGKYVLAKDLASTSRRDASIDGGVGHKQTSLLGIGLRSREKVEKAISTRKSKQ